MTVYECRCGVKVSVYVPVSLVVCGCGRQMRRQEQGERKFSLFDRMISNKNK